MKIANLLLLLILFKGHVYAQDAVWGTLSFHGILSVGLLKKLQYMEQSLADFYYGIIGDDTFFHLL